MANRSKNFNRTSSCICEVNVKTLTEGELRENQDQFSSAIIVTETCNNKTFFLKKKKVL